MDLDSKVTLKRIANDICPQWELKHWFEWPPNIFALVSIVLQRTGCYRICLNYTEWWENKIWQNSVNINAELWLDYTTSLIIGVPKIAPYLSDTDFIESRFLKILYDEFKIINNNWDQIELNNLRVISDLFNEAKKNGRSNKEIDFAVSLLKILAVADRCCVGLGLVGETLNVEKQPTKIFHGIANLLLNNTGSLSTIPKFYGIVLPKMRTPQIGMVLRSLSHHLSFHITEVEVMWRTFPLMNNNKLSLNILAIPYPSEINESDFEITNESYHAVRYFTAAINNRKDGDQTNLFLDSVIGKIFDYIDKNNSIDIVVFPETALTKEKYNYFLKKLIEIKDHFRGTKFIHLPIIIAGVMSKDENDVDQFHNEVRMATFFADKWYEITQRKHHRWNLDREQISQYQLEGYFSTDRTWFEKSSISQRRLSILAPNSWLALTSLICEDLARQEPVSEVIRGIGPTLLFALLSDGPQFASRWSARYASVLADDPGTSVLSLTSAGMVKRSQKINVSKSHSMRLFSKIKLII